LATSDKKSFWNRSGSSNENGEMSFVDHLEALRWHIVRSLVVWLVFTIILFINVDWLFDQVIFAPSQSDFIMYRGFCELSHWLHLGDALCMPPVNLQFQGNTISGPFMAALSISMIGALIVSFPYIFWEIWIFVRPALSAKERAGFQGGIVWVSLAFFTGACFGYFIVAPFTLNFLANFTLGTQRAYQYLPTLGDYIDAMKNIILGCGIAFEMPVLSYVLASIGLISGDTLRNSRRVAIVVILVIAAIITPSPDWTSQIIVALPLFLLYELSVMIAARVSKRAGKEESKEWS
jgi:sec-independent protein translocase protein TatC